MTALIRSELLQLRTLRSTYVVLSALLLLVAGLTAADLHDIGKPAMDSASELREPMVASGGIVAAVFTALLAASRVGADYRYGTIAQRILGTPVRGRLLAARMITYALVGMVAAAAVFGIAAAITLPIADARGVSLGLSASDTARLLGEVVLAGGLVTVLGTAVGFLTRSQSAAIVALFALFVGEKVFGGVLGDVAHYMPFSLLDSLLQIGGAPLGAGVAALSLTGITAAATVAAARALRTRDVT